MADNRTSNPGVGGDSWAVAELSFSGDTVGVPGNFVGILSGSEGSWTYSISPGGAGAVSAGTPRVTLASDDPGVAALGSIKTAVETLDNAIAGSEMQVDIVAALPAGANAIGKLAANSGVDIGDVDVTSIVPGAGATNLGKAEDAAHSSGDVGVMGLTVRQDTAAALGGTDADYQPFITDASGRLHVNVGNTVTVGSHAVTNAGTFAVQAACTNAGTFAVQAACTNAGTFAVQVDGSALTSLQLIDDCIFVDDAAFTPGTSKVAVVAAQADEASTDSVDEGDAGALRMTLDRKLIVTPQPHTAGGLSIFRSLDLDETEEEVKASAGQVYAAWVTNLATTTRYLKFYNATAANVTVGSTTPVITIPIPGNATDDISAVLAAGGYGIAFDTAITVAATTALADADAGAPGANEVVVNILFK